MGLSPTHSMVETPSRAFYREAMEVLSRAGVPFLVGGAFAFVHQAGIDRSTKDLDIFVRPGDVHRLLDACAAAGYEADLIYSHWLAKIRSPTGFIDVDPLDNSDTVDEPAAPPVPAPAPALGPLGLAAALLVLSALAWRGFRRNSV